MDRRRIANASNLAMFACGALAPSAHRILRCVCLAVFIIAALSAQSAFASIITIDFEGLPDSTDVSTTYQSLGVTFSNALAITAGISLDESEFPPHSGQNVVLDNGGPITLSFSVPVSSVYGYFTYASSLALNAFDATSTEVASATSLFSENFTSSGNPPNELVGVSFATGFDSVTITGDPAGGSFVMDDLTFDTSTSGTGSPTPEPSTWSLIVVGVGAAALGAAEGLF